MSLSVGDVVLVERHEVAYDKKELHDRSRQAGAQPAKIYLGCFVSRTRFDAANDQPPFAAAVHHALRRLCRPGERRPSQRLSLHLAGDTPLAAAAAAATSPPPPPPPPRLKTLAVAHSRLRRSTAASGDRTPRASARRSRLVSTAEAASDAAAGAAAAGGGSLVRRRSSLFGAGFGLPLLPPQLPSVVRQVYSHRATVLLLEGNESAALQRSSAAASRVVEALRGRLKDPTAHLCPFLYKGRLLLQVHSRFLKDNTVCWREQDATNTRHRVRNRNLKADTHHTHTHTHAHTHPCRTSTTSFNRPTTTLREPATLRLLRRASVRSAPACRAHPTRSHASSSWTRRDALSAAAAAAASTPLWHPPPPLRAGATPASGRRTRGGPLGCRRGVGAAGGGGGAPRAGHIGGRWTGARSTDTGWRMRRTTSS